MGRSSTLLLRNQAVCCCFLLCLVRNLKNKTRTTTEIRPMKIKLLSSVNKLTQRLENANLDLEFSILMRTLVTTWKVSRLFAKTVLLTLLMEVLTKPQPSSLASSLLHLFSLLHTYFTFAPSLIVHPSTFPNRLSGLLADPSVYTFL